MMDSNDDLHKQFRSLIMLLTLVTAINSSGHPTLALGTEPYKAPLEKDQPPHDLSLNAVTTLLVRDNENVATVVNKFYQVLVLQQPDSPKQDSDTDGELGSQGDEESSCANGGSEESVGGITTIQNLPEHDQQINITNRYFFVGEGTSHIGTHFGDWDTILNIP